jgi:hypothetical protein
MRRFGLFVVLAAAGFGASATTLQAQWPGRHHYNYPGYYGGWGYDYGLIYALGGGRRYYAQSQRLINEQIAAQQTAAMQRSIRDAMSAEALRRSEQTFAQQQAERDWWLLAQQQQMAGRQQAAAVAAMTAESKSVAAPKAPTDVINWPSLLQAPQFAEQRARIEAPYRRNPKGLSTPTAADYNDIIKSVEQIKLLLKEMTARLTAQEYFDTQAFLDRMAGEARQRAKEMKPKK